MLEEDSIKTHVMKMLDTFYTSMKDQFMTPALWGHTTHSHLLTSQADVRINREKIPGIYSFEIS